MRHKLPDPHRPRFCASRRRLIHGIGGLIGGGAAACSGTEGGPGPAASGGFLGVGGAAEASGGVNGTGGASGGSAGSSATGGSAGATTTRKNASDRVMLGSTGIEISRLAIGSGTHGSDGASDQTRLGMSGFVSLFSHAYGQGVTLFETADQYGAHPHVGEAMRQVGRQNVVVLTKTHAETAEELEADLARFRTELGVDMIDIVLLHNKTSGSWTTQCAGAMEALERAKESGAIRAHGVSCHSLQALELAARTDWVDVDLARINPDGLVMDSDPATVISVLTRMKAAGKGVLGMKILGEGQLGSQVERAIGHAVGLDCIDGFTIGFTSNQQLDEVTERIAAA